MAVLYTLIDVLQPPEPRYTLLAFLPGAISLVALRAAGLSRLELNLRVAPLSKAGLAALAATTLLMLPILGSASSFTGWRWLPALVYAPPQASLKSFISGLHCSPGWSGRSVIKRRSPCSFTRSSLSASTTALFRRSPSFTIFLLVAAVLFLAGCGWGWQVQRDRTVVWSMLQHSLFLVPMSLFGWD